MAEKVETDEFYSSFLALRSEPVPIFLGYAAPKWALPITSFNEDQYLKVLGLSAVQCNLIEGFVSGHSAARDEEQQVSHELVRLAANPPPSVGKMQRRTARWLIRPYPLG